MSSSRLFASIVLTVLIAGCGGGGSGGAAPVQTGTVTMTMSDAPVDGYSKIIMTVSQIRLVGSGGQDILVLDEPKEIDFLALSNFSEVLAKREVIAGTYNKIRLILDSLTLVQTDSAGHETLTDVPLHGLQKVDINPQGPFEIRGGEEIVIHVDLDLNRSIHIVQTGSGGVNFRPVIFASITAQPAFDKLFRVEGTIDSINGAASTFTVCDIRHVSDDGAHMPNPKEICVFSDPDSNTSYFGADSTPSAAGFGGLAVNDLVVMYGKFLQGAATDTFVPAVVALGSRDTLVRERGISSVFTPDPSDATAPGTMNLDEVSSVCLLAPQQRAVSVASETAVFSEDSLGAATRIDRTAIERCRSTEAEGTDVTGTPGFLRSFVVIQGQPVVAEEELVGTLALVSAGKYDMTLSPPASGTECVVTTASTVITRIDPVAGGGVDVTHPSTVPTGVEVSAIGVRDSSSCLDATEIIDDRT